MRASFSVIKATFHSNDVIPLFHSNPTNVAMQHITRLFFQLYSHVVLVLHEIRKFNLLIQTTNKVGMRKIFKQTIKYLYECSIYLLNNSFRTKLKISKTKMLRKHQLICYKHPVLYMCLNISECCSSI